MYVFTPPLRLLLAVLPSVMLSEELVPLALVPVPLFMPWT
jgi:hypothetical protein